MAACLPSFATPCLLGLVAVCPLLAIEAAATTGGEQAITDATSRSITPLSRFVPRLPIVGGIARGFSVWDMVAFLAACGLLRAWTKRHSVREAGTSNDQRQKGESSQDTGELRHHSHGHETTSDMYVTKIQACSRNIPDTVHMRLLLESIPEFGHSCGHTPKRTSFQTNQSHFPYLSSSMG